jgi:hypothetical protein
VLAAAISGVAPASFVAVTSAILLLRRLFLHFICWKRHFRPLATTACQIIFCYDSCILGPIDGVVVECEPR